MKVRIEVPILLYADLEIPDDATHEGELTDAGKRVVFAGLEYALGEIGQELAAPDSKVEIGVFTNARIYLTDHVFPVHSWDGLSLTSEEGDTPHEDD